MRRVVVLRRLVFASLLCVASCGQSGVVGTWGVGNGDTITFGQDKTFIMRTGASIVHGTYAETVKPRFALMLSGSPMGIPGCYTTDSVRIQDGNVLRIYAREKSDGTLQTRIVASTETNLSTGKIASTTPDCTP